MHDPRRRSTLARLAGAAARAQPHPMRPVRIIVARPRLMKRTTFRVPATEHCVPHASPEHA